MFFLSFFPEEQRDIGKASLNSLALWGIIFVPRSWRVFLFFSFLVVVADTLGKQFVSHLIAFEKLKQEGMIMRRGWGH